RKVQVGDNVIIIAYGSMKLDEAREFQPKVIIVDNNNHIKK
ncbi:MAG: aspartate 1-decarboxylase, partial [Alphaproteobacteria bacterium]